MAPVNDLNGPAIAFLITSVFFLVLLMTIWYRYLTWWRRNRRRKRIPTEGSAGSPPGTPSDPEIWHDPLPDDQRPGRPRSNSPSEPDRRMPGAFPRERRLHRTPEDSGRRRRDSRRMDDRAEPRVQRLKRNEQPERDSREIIVDEVPLREPQRERWRDTRYFTPPESNGGASSRRDGRRRVSFSGRQSFAEPPEERYDGNDEWGQRRADSEHEFSREEDRIREEPRMRRRRDRESTVDNSRPIEIQRDNGRAYRDNNDEIGSMAGAKGSEGSEGQRERDEDSNLEEVRRMYRYSDRGNSRRREEEDEVEDEEEATFGPHRENSPQNYRREEDPNAW